MVQNGALQVRQHQLKADSEHFDERRGLMYQQSSEGGVASVVLNKRGDRDPAHPYRVGDRKDALVDQDLVDSSAGIEVNVVVDAGEDLVEDLGRKGGEGESRRSYRLCRRGCRVSVDFGGAFVESLEAATYLASHPGEQKKSLVPHRSSEREALFRRPQPSSPTASGCAG